MAPKSIRNHPKEGFGTVARTVKIARPARSLRSSFSSRCLLLGPILLAK